MITPSFNLTATERVLPKLALDFTTASLDNRITFTRTTGASNPATYVNSSGVVTAATNNQPRFDYNPIALVCKGLLIEESRENKVIYSEDLSNAVWTKSATSVSTNAAVSPDGATTADKLVEDTSTGAHYTYEQKTGLTVTTYTWSIFAKAAGRNWIYLTEGNNVTATAWFDLANGVTGTVSGTGSPSATITNYGNGWYRCTMTATIIASVFNCQVRMGTANGTGSYTGDGTSGVYLWGGQLEAGAFATSYIPTTTAALTRNADVATITGTNFSNFWRAGKGGVLVRALPSTVSGTRPLVQFDDNTADNIIALRGNTTNPELYIRSGGVDQATIDAGAISAAAYRLAGTWAAGNAAASLNSGAAVLGAPGAIPAVTQARLGSDGTNYLNGHLQAIEYYDSRILNGNLPLLSSSAGYNRVLGPVLRDQVNVSQVNHRVIY